MTRAFLLLVAACGPASHAPVHTVTAARSDAGVAVAAPVEHPSDAECTQLIAHAVAMDGAELSAEAQARIVGDLAATQLASCKRLERAQVACGLAAPTTTAMVACQDSFNSSTSNSSVAPPGIAPPAPRSP